MYALLVKFIRTNTTLENETGSFCYSQYVAKIFNFYILLYFYPRIACVPYENYTRGSHAIHMLVFIVTCDHML